MSPISGGGWVVGGWQVGVLDGIKAILSPAGAWAWAELGNMADMWLI